MGESKHRIGEVLHETYRLERLIGEGAMGMVYEASHLRLRRRFAVKLLLKDTASYAEAVARFRREAEVTSGLGHPNIVEMIDFNHTDEGAPYIVMELLQGEDLSTRLEKHKMVGAGFAASVLDQTCSAVEAAHGQGVIHRDLKPQNLFLSQKGDVADVVKVLDFGISKVLGSRSMLTAGDSLLGTPCYMAPEQAEGRAADVDLRTDVYAMGAILYQMLAGRPPFMGESVLAILYQVVHNAPEPLIKYRPDVPYEVERVVLQSLSKRPDDRPGSMSELARLSSLLRTHGTGVLPEGGVDTAKESGQSTIEADQDEIEMAVGPTLENTALVVDEPDLDDDDEPLSSPPAESSEVASGPGETLPYPPTPRETPADDGAEPDDDDKTTDKHVRSGTIGQSSTLSSSTGQYLEVAPRPGHRRKLLLSAAACVLLLAGGGLYLGLGGNGERGGAVRVPASGATRSGAPPASAAAAGALHKAKLAEVARSRPDRTPPAKAAPKLPSPASKPGPAAKPDKVVTPVRPGPKPASARKRPGAIKVGAMSGRKPICVEVFVDGKPRGFTPLLVRRVKPGRHTVVARHKDYKPVTRTVTVRPGRTAPMLFQLRR